MFQLTACELCDVVLLGRTVQRKENDPLGPQGAGSPLLGSAQPVQPLGVCPFCSTIEPSGTLGQQQA